MSLRNILKYAFIGTVAYGIYKLGESQGQKKSSDEPKEDKDFVDIVDDAIQENKKVIIEQIDYISSLIQKLKSKPNKTRQDRDNIDLLQIKLNQLNKNL